MAVIDPERLRIGIVDDDISFREALEGWLGSLGHRPQGYASAEDFLWSGRPEDLHCLLIDIQMIGMDGLELQSQLAGSGHAPPIIFISSQDDQHTRARALSAGAMGFFGKPVDYNGLIALLDSISESLSRA